MSYPYAYDVPTEGHLVSDELAAVARHAAAADTQAADVDTQPAKPTDIPVLVSHAVTYVLAVLLTGVNATVWDLVPGGLAGLLSVVSILVQLGVTAGLAWWAHQRSRPVAR